MSALFAFPFRGLDGFGGDREGEGEAIDESAFSTMVQIPLPTKQTKRGRRRVNVASKTGTDAAISEGESSAAYQVLLVERKIRDNPAADLSRRAFDEIRLQ